MNFPLRVILALTVIGAVAEIGLWVMPVGGIVVAMAAWLIFVRPAYWD